MAVLTLLSNSHNCVVCSRLCYPCFNFTRLYSSLTLPPPKSKRTGGKGKYPLLVFPLITFSLGCWQVQRRKWKIHLLEIIHCRINTEPLPLPSEIVPKDLYALEYTPFKLVGEYLHDKELYIEPRSLISPTVVTKKRLAKPPQSSFSQSSSGSFMSDPTKTGLLVVTPFKLKDSNDVILVNRGWVPLRFRHPTRRIKGQVAGEVSLTGIVRRPENKPWFHPPHDSEEVFAFRDIERMSQASGALPIYFDAALDTTIQFGPVGGQTRVNLRNTHLEYIITWWTLTFFCCLLWYKRFIR